MKHRYDYDLIVIGSGAGGGLAANQAASNGKKVLIIERDTPGGECPNFGCVPTKGLLYAAERFEIAQHSQLFGVHAHSVTVNYSQVHDWKDTVVSRTGTALGPDAFRHAGVEYIHGTAKFLTEHAVKVGRRDGITAKNFLIATGSSVFVPPIPGLAEAGYMTYRELIDVPKPPKSLFIIGGGPIGAEFAQVFSSFGTKVVIADALPHLLGREDADAGNLIGAIFESRGIKLFLESAVKAVKKTSAGKEVEIETKHGTRHVTVEDILVATGKRANTNLDLENANVAYGKFGIKVNPYMQTTTPNIYAAGDVVGPYLFTHTGEYQSKLAANNMFSRKQIRADYRSVPRCTYVTPEVASVGYSEESAKAEGLKVRVGAVPLSIIGRANTSDEMNGFVKVITDPKGVIIGGVIVAPRAGELIHELALAVQLRATAKAVGDMIHAYPSYSEAVKFAATAATSGKLQ